MVWRVEITDKKGIFDSAGEAALKDIEDLGITSVKKVNIAQVYLLDGKISAAQARKICERLLVDPVVQDFRLLSKETPASGTAKDLKIIEIAYHPGVMDPVEASTIKGIKDLGVRQVSSVRTAKKYFLYGNPSAQEIQTIVNRVLANKLIQHVVAPGGGVKAKKKQLARGAASESKVQVKIIEILKASDKELERLSSAGQLFLNLSEMKAIQAHFRRLGRNPTDCELETIAQTWSEHCHHKTFRGNIAYTVHAKGKATTTHIKSLLKSTIMKATKEINAPWCVSVFHDNSGVIAFDDEDHVCFKVETHNHPSALEPFGGANTGIGGVIRDCLGTGLGAKPIANTDIFCFAPPDWPFKDLPEGTLHPKRVMKGVVNGVRDYGNKMGIPTVNGAILFDKGFIGNPLVYCGTLGIIPKDKVEKKAHPGDLIVAVGGRTGRDGIHGATFSSGELTEESETVSSGAVQIGNPIEEKKMLDVILEARDEGLYRAITDCGAGGFSSAVGEMAQEIGCRVDLDKAPVKYQGLNYEEIWISEAQERMVMAVPPKKLKKFLEVFAAENVEATVIGTFTSTGRLELFFKGVQVCDLDMAFIHDGIPQITKKAVWQEPRHASKINPVKVSATTDLSEKLKEVLSHLNVCSKENVIRRYDHEVQGASVIKPLVGPLCDGPSDASVIRPKLGSDKGVAVANGINVLFGKIDPYHMAASCIDEAVRQIIAVGGSMKQIALLDNFCWGNPDKPDRLGSLVRCAQGLYDTAVGFGTPFISGKDSLYNEYALKGKTLAIPGTILISGIGVVDDVGKCVTMDLKEAGNLIYVVGVTRDELGGSIYLDTFGMLGKNVPKVDVKSALKNFLTVEKAIQKGWVRSVHDCSEGGLAVAFAEMAFGGDLGALINLKDVPFQGKDKRNDTVLFSESNSRLVLEVSAEHQKDMEVLLKPLDAALIGCVKEEKELVIFGIDGAAVVKASVRDLKENWKKTLRW